MNGLFITFEGTEGSGKSTQIRILADRLQQAGYTVQCLREPGGTPVGEEIRRTLKESPASNEMTPEAELLLMNACRAQLVRQVIRPALSQGHIVLCDRFADSTLAYQGFGRQLDLDQVRSIVRFAVGPTQPDLTLLLEIPLAVSESRRHQRASARSLPRDRFEESGSDFFSRVEHGFAAIAQSEPERILRIDGSQPVQAVSRHIWEAVSPRIPAAPPRK